MKVSNFYFTLFLSLLVQSLCGQSVKHVNLKYRVPDEVYERSQAIVPVFTYKGDSIEEFSRFGIEEKKPLKKFKIILPDLSGCMDTAYGYLYFGAVERAVNPGYRMVVVGNYRRRYGKKARIFIDHNDNFDLRDDGPADSLYGSDTRLDVILRNPYNPEGKYIVRLSYFPFGENVMYKHMLNEHYNKHSGTKVFSSADFSFREQRLNVLAGDYYDGMDSFRLAVQDVNCNGLFNDAGVDRIFVVPYKTYKITDEAQTVVDEKRIDRTVFEWNYKQYNITALDSAGRFIEFRHNPRAKLKYALRENQKVPKVSFVTTDGKKNKTEKLRRYRWDWVYLYFWNTSSPGYVEDLATLRLIQSRYGKQVTIIALNYGDNINRVQRYVRTDSMTWKNGASTEEINDKFFVKQMPAGYLLKTRNRLAKAGDITPQQLLILLNSGTSLKKTLKKEKKGLKGS